MQVVQNEVDATAWSSNAGEARQPLEVYGWRI